MVNTLEPVLSKFAVSLFMVGTLGAGLSSVFPILMITPILIADYQSGEFDIHLRQFKIIAAVACLVGLTVPVFGANLINDQILSQVLIVFVLTLVILGIIFLMNREKLMGVYKVSRIMNI